MRNSSASFLTYVKLNLLLHLLDDLGAVVKGGITAPSLMDQMFA